MYQGVNFCVGVVKITISSTETDTLYVLVIMQLAKPFGKAGCQGDN